MNKLECYHVKIDLLKKIQNDEIFSKLCNIALIERIIQKRDDQHEDDD